MMPTADFECFCGGAFASREQLIQHNVHQHDMDENESRRLVMEKYPEE